MRQSRLRHSGWLLAACISIGCVLASQPQQDDSGISDQDVVQACQESQVAYSEAYSSAFQPRVVTVLRTYTSTSTLLTYDLFSVVADIYTTIDGVPHAHSSVDARSVGRTSGPYVGATSYTTTITSRNNISFTTPRPTCTIETVACSSLWQSYFASLGLPTNIEGATEPAITPVPSNRPRCSVAPIQAVCQTLPTPSCIISADRVDLFYWPTLTTPATVDDAAVTAVIDGVTFTSPSVYLRFAQLQALTSSDLDVKCVISSPLGATGTMGFLGGGALRPVHGGPVTNALVSIHPTELSSLIRDLGSDVNTASVVSEIAHGGPNYKYWLNAVAGTGRNYVPPSTNQTAFGGAFSTSVVAVPVNFADFERPSAEAYYLNINTPPGCDRIGPQEHCGIVFDDSYHAQLLVPDAVRNLRPEWATCIDPLYGAYDPPQALQAQTYVDGPTRPAQVSATLSSFALSITPASAQANLDVTTPLEASTRASSPSIALAESLNNGSNEAQSSAAASRTDSTRSPSISTYTSAHSSLSTVKTTSTTTSGAIKRHGRSITILLPMYISLCLLIA